MYIYIKRELLIGNILETAEQMLRTCFLCQNHCTLLNYRTSPFLNSFIRKHSSQILLLFKISAYEKSYRYFKCFQLCEVGDSNTHSLGKM